VSQVLYNHATGFFNREGRTRCRQVAGNSQVRRPAVETSTFISPGTGAWARAALEFGNPPLSCQVAGFLLRPSRLPHGNTGGNKMFRKILVLLAMLLPAAAAAQTLDTTTLEPVVVTASRIDREISRTPAHVSIIDEAKIATSNARNVPDLLRNEAGVFVTDTTGNGRKYNIDLRGFGETSGQNVLLLIDGRRINQADLSGIDWSLISLERIQRIEIVRGSRGSVLYGDNATGGVINIITKEGGEFNVGGKTSYGSHDTFNASIFNSAETSALSYSLSAAFQDTDGYRDNSNSEAKDIGVGLRFYPSDHVTFDLSSDYHKDKTGLPGAILLSDLNNGVSRRTATNPDDYTEIEDYYLKGGSEIFFNEQGSLRLDASYRQRNNEAFASFFGGNYTGKTAMDTTALTPRLVLKNEIFSMGNSIIIGVDYYDTKASVDNRSEFFGSVDVATYRFSKKNYSGYIQNELAFNNNLDVSVGYRHDRASYDFGNASTEKPKFTENIFSTGLNFRYRGSSYLYLSYATGFRYPALDELFNYMTNTVTTDFEAQRTNNIEIGFKEYFGQGFSLQGNLFHLETKNEIFYNPITFSNENFDDKTRRQGFEATISKTFSRFELGGSYTYTETKILGGQYKGNRVPNVPQHMATVNALIHFTDKANLNLNANYIGKRHYISDFENGSANQDDFMVFNTRIQYNCSEFITLYLNLNNILDEKYAENGVQRWDGELAVYPSPRFNAFAGLIVSY
jgi:iron complex outermembrane receptor protein